MIIKNIYTTNRKTLRNEIFEGRTICRKGGKGFYLGLIFLIGSTGLCYFQNKEPEYLVYSFLFLSVGIITLLIEIIKASQVSKGFKQKEIHRKIFIDGKEVIEEFFNQDNELLKTEKYAIDEIIRIAKGVRYIYIFLGDNRACVLKKDGFVEGNISDLIKEVDINNRNSKPIIAPIKSDGFKIQKIFLCIGSIFSVVMTLVYSKVVGIEPPVVLNGIKMIIAGMILFLWLSFAAMFFIEWHRKQNNIIKIVSVILYPITLFIFLLIGLVKGIPYTVAQFKNM